MKKHFFYSIAAICLGSCSGSDAGDVSYTDNIDSQTTEDSIVWETGETSDNVVIYQGTVDGPENSFYIYSEQELEITDAVDEIHIVPPSDIGGSDSSYIYEYMLAVVANDFDLYCEAFEDYTGTVKIFYNANRENMMAACEIFQQKATGRVRVYSPEGDLIIDREYNDEGKCILSSKDVYAIDWKFIPSTAELQISNLDKYETTNESGNRVIEMGPSMHESSGKFQNNLYALLEKPVFENSFTINEEAFTGILIGYFAINSMQRNQYFELSFLNGYLNDTIRIYNDWGELELEELFAEGELIETIYKLDYSQMDGMAKPVIYLYPDEEMAVNVQLNLNGKLTHSYPKYPADGWNVKAQPDGTLYDENGKEFYALFWEGVSQTNFTYSEGFVVRGEETELFLENSLEILGLTRREANEFIMYWLPQMENNDYNLIHFSSKEYEEIAGLKITPEPESLIRIMMVWSPLESKIEIPQQNLFDMKAERNGFTVVEWGGKMQEFSFQPAL